MVKIYAASIDNLLDSSYFEQKKRKISEERRKKIDLCNMQKDKVRSLAAGLLLQAAWEEYGNRSEKQIEITYALNGKPVCVNDSKFHFNLSHSGLYVACAVSNAAVGIDIQQVKQIDLLVAKRFFLAEEYELIQKALPKEQSDLFCKLWAGKESYIKYTGDGMKRRMNTFMVDIKGNFICDRENNQITPVKWYRDISYYQIAVCGSEGIFVERPIFHYSLIREACIAKITGGTEMFFLFCAIEAILIESS